MAKTGGHLKVVQMGDSAMGVRLEGDPRKPEPIHFRVVLPVGADIDIVRLDNGEYWIHVAVNNDEATGHDPCKPSGKLVAARLDVTDKHASEVDYGDFEDPGLFHLALRVAKEGDAKN